MTPALAQEAGSRFVPETADAYRRVRAEVSGMNREIDRVKSLTDSERAIIDLVAQGFKNAHIAARLCLVEGTVQKQLELIFKKLHVLDRFELIIYAYWQGLA
jgi:DNA-binding NarL/FixJ family response regulator